MSNDVVANAVVLAKRWGINVVEGRPGRHWRAVFSDFEVSPSDCFGLGASVQHGVIVRCPQSYMIARNAGIHALAVLHEIAHIIVQEPLDSVQEIRSGMLWFEWVMHTRIGAAAYWMDWMSSYMISTPSGPRTADMWTEASPEDRRAALNESRRGAVQRGLLKPAGPNRWRWSYKLRPALRND